MPYKAKSIIRSGAKDIAIACLDSLIETIDHAVRFAHAHAQSGDTVLLAPACASFDQFKNYEHRGQVFKDLVHRLEPKH